MGWLSSAIGGASSLIGGALSNSANRHAASQQHEWNVSDYQHRYQWTIQDMEKAGLNPILAATQGIGGSINGASALASQYNLGEGVTQGMAGDAAHNSAKAAQKQADVAADVGQATADKLKSDITLNGSSARKLDADTSSANLANQLFEKTFENRVALSTQELENARKTGEFIDEQRAAKKYEKDVVMPAMAGMYVANGNASNSAASYNNILGVESSERTNYQRSKNRYFERGFSDDGSLWSSMGRTAQNAFDGLSNFVNKYYLKGR